MMSTGRRSRWSVAIRGAVLTVAVPAGMLHPFAVEPARHPAGSPDPPLSLERVIDLRGSVTARGRFARWATGGDLPAVLGRPYGVAWDGDALLLTDPEAGRVVRVDERGRWSATAVGSLEGPIGIAVCPGGIVVTDARTGDVVLLERDLRRMRRIARGLERPTGVACDARRIFVLETGRHQLIVLQVPDRPAGVEAAAVSAVWGRRGDGDGEFNFPTALACHDGSLWIGDTLNFRVQKLDASSGAYVRSFGSLGDAPGEMPRIKGLAVDSRGRIWISDAYLDEVSLYSSDGQFLTSLGLQDSGVDGFSFPAGIAADDTGRVAVVDSLNLRVKIFRVGASGSGRAR